MAGGLSAQEAEALRLTASAASLRLSPVVTMVAFGDHHLPSSQALEWLYLQAAVLLSSSSLEAAQQQEEARITHLVLFEI